MTGKSDLKERGEYSGQSEGNHEQDREEGDKKTRYRTYAGAIVTEEIVKLSEKVIVPVKEYPKVSFLYDLFDGSSFLTFKYGARKQQ